MGFNSGFKGLKDTFSYRILYMLLIYFFVWTLVSDL